VQIDALVNIIVEASSRCIEERVSHHRTYRKDSGAPKGQEAFCRAVDAN